MSKIEPKFYWNILEDDIYISDSVTSIIAFLLLEIILCMKKNFYLHKVISFRPKHTVFANSNYMDISCPSLNKTIANYIRINDKLIKSPNINIRYFSQHWNLNPTNECSRKAQLSSKSILLVVQIILIISLFFPIYIKRKKKNCI